MISKLPPGEVLQPYHAWIGIKRKIFDAMCSEHKKDGLSFNAFLNKLVRPTLEEWYARREQKEMNEEDGVGSDATRGADR